MPRAWMTRLRNSSFRGSRASGTSKRTASGTTSCSMLPSASRLASSMSWRLLASQFSAGTSATAQSSDGKFYDWFARLRFKGTHEEARALVSSALAPVASEGAVALPSAPAPTRLEDLEAQVEQLLELTAELPRISALRAELEATVLRQQLTAATGRGNHSCPVTSIVRWGTRSRSVTRSPNSAGPRSKPSTSRRCWRSSPRRRSCSSWRSRRTPTFVQPSYFRERAEQRRSAGLELGGNCCWSPGSTGRAQASRSENGAGPPGRESRRAAVSQVFIDSAFARLTFVSDSVEVLANLDAPLP